MALNHLHWSFGFLFLYINYTNLTSEKASKGSLNAALVSSATMLVADSSAVPDAVNVAPTVQANSVAGLVADEVCWEVTNWQQS